MTARLQYLKSSLPTGKGKQTQKKKRERKKSLIGSETINAGCKHVWMTFPFHLSLVQKKKKREKKGTERSEGCVFGEKSALGEHHL